MEISELYAFAESRMIDIDSIRTKSIASVSVRLDGGKCAIGIDESKMSDSSELKSVLAHEIGHCETGAFYTETSYLELRSRCEYRADKWAVRTLLPKSEMENAMRCGETQVWQLAEHFGVDEELIIKALFIYFDDTSHGVSLWSAC